MAQIEEQQNGEHWSRTWAWPPRWTWPTVLLMLLLMAGEIATSVHGESVSWDEGDHLFSGYMSLRTHDYGLNPEHPPMAKMVAALPLLPLQLRVPPLQGRFFKTEAYLDGRELLFRNDPRYGGSYTAPQLIFRARLAMLIFPLTLALLVFLTAREMFGVPAGLLALFFTVLEPNILAHGPFVTTDSAASAGFLAAIFCFYRFCRASASADTSLARKAGLALLTGIAGGFALAAKHSTFFLLPMFLALLFVETARHAYLRHRAAWTKRMLDRSRDDPGVQRTVSFRMLSREEAEQQSRTLRIHSQSTFARAIELFTGLAAIIVTAVLVLWCFYGWRYNARPAGLALNPSLAATCAQIRPAEGRILMAIAHARLLPESYLYGLADIRNVGNTWPSYLFGKVYAHGIWPYFPISLLIKSTLPELLLLLLAIVAIATGKLKRGNDTPWREIAFLAVPMLIYLLAGMNSGLNIGMRHVLPLYPLAIVLAAGGAVALAWNSPPWRYVLLALGLWQAGTSLHAYPNYIPYSNEAFGGPASTHKYLTDSSVDWGQQLLAVKKYTDAHNIHDCWFAYFVDPFVQAKDYGIPCRNLPTWDNMSSDEVNPVPTTITGPVFISQGTLTGYEYRSAVLNPFASFTQLKPDAVIQDGVFVYNGTFHTEHAAAMSHLALSRITLKNNDMANAIREGEAAVALWPEGVEQQEQLGDALHAAGRQDEAEKHYSAALATVAHDMEPSAYAVWGPELRAKLCARKPDCFVPGR